jgi:type VI secretion system secreted protein Hcp
MAVDTFIKLDGIKGEAQDSKHKDEIDVLSWSWGLTQTGTMHGGGGGGAGKVNVHDLNFTKYVDKSSCDLMLRCCSGKHIPSAELTVRKAADKPLEYLKIKLEEILVTSFQTSGSAHDERQTENVTLNFAKFKVEYQIQKPDGSGTNAGNAGWDIKKNVKV